MKIPLPLLLDLIACEQIKKEGFEHKVRTDDIFDMLSVR